MKKKYEDERKMTNSEIENLKKQIAELRNNCGKTINDKNEHSIQKVDKVLKININKFQEYNTIFDPEFNLIKQKK